MPDIPFSQLIVETIQKISQYIDLPRPCRNQFNFTANHFKKIAAINAIDVSRIIKPEIVVKRKFTEGANHTVNREIDKIKINKITEYILVLIFPFEPLINLYLSHIQEMTNMTMNDSMVRIILKTIEKSSGGLGINGNTLTSLFGTTLNNIKPKVNSNIPCLAISSFIENLFLSPLIR